MSADSNTRYSAGHFLRILDSKDDRDIRVLNADLLPHEIELVQKNMERLKNEEKEKGAKDNTEKHERDYTVLKKAPIILDYLSTESRDRFEEVKDGLEKLKIKFTFDPHLVRGLDYYTHTTFEFVDNSFTGRQAAVLGGGRYDSLFELMGGLPTPAIGFAAGVDRLLLLRRSKNIIYKENIPVVAIVVFREKDAKNKKSTEFSPLHMYGIKIAQTLRYDYNPSDSHSNISVLFYSSRGIRNLMDQARRANAKICLIVGEEEITKQDVKVKHMDTGHQLSVPFTELITYLQQHLSAPSK